MIDDVETPLARRPVDRGDVDEAVELAALVIAQERDDLDDVARRRRDGQLVVRDPMADHRAGSAPAMVSPRRSSVSSIGYLLQRSIVPVRRIFFCSSSTP